MLTTYDQIQDLRAELASCILTRRERTQAQAELKKLVVEQAKLDRVRRSPRRRSAAWLRQRCSLTKQDS